MTLFIDQSRLEHLISGKGFTHIQQIFDTLILKLKSFLNLTPVYQHLKFQITEIKEQEEPNILDLGVRRIIDNDSITITIYDKFRKFFPFILLREVYFCFIPEKVLNNEIIKICINQIVENSLAKISTIKAWKKEIRDSLVNRAFLESQLDKLQKFFRLEEIESPQNFNIIKFFITEIREGNLIDVAKHDPTHFYNFIFERYSYKIFKSLLNPDMIETLRVLILIFHEKKSYMSLVDYYRLFQKFKESKKIDSNLSLRKFKENMQWINKNTPIAPSYDKDLTGIGLIILWVNITFHPLLEREKIKLVLSQIPFHHSLSFSENSFGTDIALFFTIPKIYIKNFLNFIIRLEEFGFIIKKRLFQAGNKQSSLNLNYYLDESNLRKITDPEHGKYDPKYEIIINNQVLSGHIPVPLTFLDYIILTRSFNVSHTGLTFDKRRETLNAIKEDVENEARNHISITNEFKDSFDEILSSQDLKIQFLHIIEENKRRGFLFLHSQLKLIIAYIEIVENILNEYSDIKNITHLRTILDKNVAFQNIENNLRVRHIQIKKIIFRDYIPLYFQSKSKDSFKDAIFKIKTIYNLLNACYNLRRLDLRKIKKILENPILAEKIYQERDRNYEKIIKPVRLYKITKEKVESVINKFLIHEPPLINPLLLNTIFASPFAKYYPCLIIEDTPQARKEVEKLCRYFPKAFLYNCKDINTNKEYLLVLIYFINIEEKSSLLSSKYSFFKRFFWRGLIRKDHLQFRNFFAFEDNRFYYSEDLFPQLLIYSREVLGEKLVWPKYKLSKSFRIQEIFFPVRQNMNILVKAVKRRVLNQDIDFDLEKLKSLSELITDLTTILLNRPTFIDIKKKTFFKKYIKSINFIPSFQNFGFSQYSLYIRPIYYTTGDSALDFKLLFLNSFQNIKYSACVETNPALLIEYIFPYRTPNKSYLNWLRKSKKNINEYCLFFKKKLYDIIHFDHNLTKEGWEYSAPRFKSYLEEVLFNPLYNPIISGMRSFDLAESTNLFGLDTQEYSSLTHIYNTNSIDIKSYLGSLKHSTIKEIQDLLEKKLIFPYLILQNLDFQEKISIIIPDIKKDDIKKMIQIFHYFNLCQIYEIEGEYFIFGFNSEISFENGLLINLWLPKCEIDEFFEVFELVFKYFKITHYLILTDIINGTHLIKSVYGRIDFFKNYNPLTTLIWNKKDNKWMNHKLFTEKFQKIYPDLFYKN